MLKGRPLHILIVDDEDSIRRILPRLFHRAGHRVKTAANGQEALSIVSESSNNFDVVITDHEMPELRGDDFVRGLKATGFAGTVFVCSAFLTPDLTSHYRQLGVRECLSKPVPWEDLRERVNEIAAV